MRVRCLILFLPLVALAELESHAFENGAHFGSDKESAKALKEIGYSGIGSAKLLGSENRIANYWKYGLQVQSIYVGATLQKETPAGTNPEIFEAMPLLKMALSLGHFRE